MTQEITAISIHESAHCVCLILAGGRVIRVRAGYNTVTDGSHPGFHRNDFNCEHPFTRQAVMILLTGTAAEAKLTGCANLYGAGTDIRQLMVSLLIKGHADVEYWSHQRIYSEFSSDAKAFVKHPLRWEMIQKFASELQKKHEISGQAAFRFVENEVGKWPMNDQLEFWFPRDSLGGDALPAEAHGA